MFASRLNLFHDDPLEVWDERAIPDAEVQQVMALGPGSWASARLPEIERKPAG